MPSKELLSLSALFVSSIAESWCSPLLSLSSVFGRFLFIGDWKKHWIKWLFHHQNTGRKLCIAFLDLYAKILNALQSEDFLIWVFLICYSQKMMSKTCSRWVVSFFTEITFQFLSAISARSLIHSPAVLKTKPTASVFWFCLSAQYTWADRVHIIRC